MPRKKRSRSNLRHQSKLRSRQWYRGCDQGGSATPKKKPTNAGSPAFYRSAKWRGLRAHVLERDKNICMYCGWKAIQVDHIKPRGSGGPDTADNLVACCTSCNRVAGGRVFDSFDQKKTWLLRTRKIQTNTLVFPVKRIRRTPEVINVQ